MIPGWVSRLVSSRVGITPWGGGAFLALVGHTSSDGITIKILYKIDDLLRRSATQLILNLNLLLGPFRLT